MSNNLKDYDYNFPSELVAQVPFEQRDASRMMVLSKDKQIQHATFRDLSQFLHPGDLVIANNTRVLACRLFAEKPTGGKLEVFLLRPLGELEWSVFFSPARGLKEGMRLKLFSRHKNLRLDDEIKITSLIAEDFRIAFASVNVAKAIITQHGETPLPPYIERSAPQAEDRERYQTTFAEHPGAVAAPTAGLHFTDAVRESLLQRDIHWATLTLHVGAGTFLPVKTENIDAHLMHAEWYQIPRETLEAVQACRARGGRVMAVGTTTLRALESWAFTQQASGWTQLYIRPGFQFQVVDLLLTNFHQPKSTLLILVSALVGREFILRAYEEAIQKAYRLFSYGDCMLVQR